MSKTEPINVRLEPDEKAALERAALADDRSMSAMARKILVDWLRTRGHIKAGGKHRAPKV